MSRCYVRSAMCCDQQGPAGWRGTGTELRRLVVPPGYGEREARILLALLGKQLGVQPDGWREAAGDFGERVRGDL